ncbi:hypothetical protein RAD16_21515 [Bradyrhizobium sp. 18BD]
MPAGFFVVRATVTDASKRARDALTKLVADFNRDWPEMKHTRETLVLAQEFAK